MMRSPGNTRHFDVLTGNVLLASQINTPLSQISGYISQQQMALIDEPFIKIPVVAGEGLTARDAAYINVLDGKMYAIDSDAVSALSGTIRGFVETTVAASATGSLVIGGILTGFSSLTPWMSVYADSTGAGTITQIRPFPLLDSGQVAIVPMGVAISATKIVVLPKLIDCKIRYQKRFSPVLDEVATIEHGQNPRGFGRKAKAYVTQPAPVAAYSSTNQDTGVQLRGEGYPGGSANSGTQSDGNDMLIGEDGEAEYRAAQSFRVSETGRLSQFTFTMLSKINTPVGNLGWEIRTDSGGSGPTNGGTTVLVSGSIFNSSVVAPGLNTVNVTNGPILLSGTTYWLCLIALTDQPASTYWKWAAANPGTYADGQAASSTNGGTSWGLGSLDTTFTVTTVPIVMKDKLAQTFTIGSSQIIETIDLYLKKTGSPTGTATVRIETVDGSNNPTGTLAHANATATFAESSLGTSYATKTVMFTRFTLSAGTYAIVLSTDRAASNTNYIEWGADSSSPSYVGGEMKTQVSPTWSNQGADAIFTLSGILKYINPVSVDWWASTKADVVNQFGDASGENVDTKTTFKCKLPAGFADVTVEVVL